MIDTSTFTLAGDHLLQSKYRIEWHDYHSDQVGGHGWLEYALSGTWSIHFTACNKLGTAGNIGVIGVANGHDSYEATSDIGPAIYVKYETRTWTLVYRKADETETTDNTTLLDATYDYRPTFWTLTYTTGTGAIEAKVYSRSDRAAATLIDTLTVAGEASKTFTHLLAAMADEADNTVIGGYVGEIYVNETPPSVFCPSTQAPAVVFDPDFSEDFTTWPGSWTVESNKIIGATEATTTNNSTGFIVYNQYTTGGSAYATSMKVYCRVNSNVRLAIYSDSSGHPGTLLVESASTALTAGDWRSISITPTLLSASTAYWLAAQCQTAGGTGYRSATGFPREYQIQAYGAFPATATPTDQDEYEDGMQVWGVAEADSLSQIHDLSSTPGGRNGHGIKVVIDETNQCAIGATYTLGSASTFYANMTSWWIYVDSLGAGKEAQLFAIQKTDYATWTLGATVKEVDGHYYWRARSAATGFTADVGTQTTFECTLDTWHHVTLAVKRSNNDDDANDDQFGCMYVDGVMVDSILVSSDRTANSKIDRVVLGYFGGLTTTKGGTYYIAGFDEASGQHEAGTGVLFGTTFFPHVARGGANDNTLVMTQVIDDVHVGTEGASYEKIFISTNNGAQDSWVCVQTIAPIAHYIAGFDFPVWANNSFWLFRQKYYVGGAPNYLTDIWEMSADGTSTWEKRVTDYGGWITPSRIINSSNEILCGVEDFDDTDDMQYWLFETGDDWTMTEDSTIVATNLYSEPFLYLEGDQTIDDDLAVILRGLDYGTAEHSHYDAGAGTWSAVTGSSNMGNIPNSWEGLTGGLGAFRFRGKLYFQARMSFGNYTGMQAFWVADPDTLDIIAQYMLDPVGDADDKSTGAYYWESGNGGVDASDYQGGYYLLDYVYDHGIAVFQRINTGELAPSLGRPLFFGGM